MKNSVFEQFATVKEDTASLFDAKLNAELQRLKAYNPSVKFSETIPFYARISYVVNESTPETIEEASAVEGVRFVCAQCPLFVAPLKEDGTEDRRCKWGDCDRAELGRTYKDSPACEYLYELIKEGGIRICFAD